AFISKTEEGLLECLEKVMELQKRAENMRIEGDRCYNPGWHTARDLRFTLKVSEVIVRSALERKESRGAQWRLDYPAKDEAWGKKNLIVAKDNEQGAVKIT